MALNAFTDYDCSPITTQQAEFFQEIDNLNAEDYAYFLAYGEVPPAADLTNETEAA